MVCHAFHQYGRLQHERIHAPGGKTAYCMICTYLEAGIVGVPKPWQHNI